MRVKSGARRGRRRCAAAPRRTRSRAAREASFPRPRDGRSRAALHPATRSPAARFAAPGSAAPRPTTPPTGSIRGRAARLSQSPNLQPRTALPLQRARARRSVQSWSSSGPFISMRRPAPRRARCRDHVSGSNSWLEAAASASGGSTTCHSSDDSAIIARRGATFKLAGALVAAASDLLHSAHAAPAWLAPCPDRRGPVAVPLPPDGHGKLGAGARHASRASPAIARCASWIGSSRRHQVGQDVYFPLTCVLSTVVDCNADEIVEVATLGNEGMAGLAVFLGVETPSMFETFAQVPGRVLWRRAQDFRAHLAEDARLTQILGRYARGTIEILDRRTLEKRACDCYRIIRAAYARPLPPPAQAAPA